MADRKENELTKANNFAYVRALDSNGNSIQISKSDLVSVLGGLLPVATPTSKGLITNNEKKYFPQEYKTSSEETSYLEIASGFPESFYGLIKVSYIRVVHKEGGLIYIEVSRHNSQDFQLNALTHVIFGNLMKVYLDRNNNKIYISVKSFTNVSVSYESNISSSYCITAKEGNTVSSVAGFIEV